MMRTSATAMLTLMLLAAGPALAQTGEEQGPRQEGITSGPIPATNAITKTEDTPVIEQNEEERDGDLTGEGFDVDVTRETPDPDPEQRPATAFEPDPGRATRSADPDAGAGLDTPHMFPGQIAPSNEGPTGRGQASAEELNDYTVHLADVERFGKVEGLIINLETGAVERLVVSAGGGLLGMGGARYEIPFDQVAAIDTGTKEMRVAVSREQIELPGDTTESATRD